MHPLLIHDVKAPEGSIFIDNLMVCSADRLLHTRYVGIDPRVFSNPVVGVTLLHYDLLNLAALVESLVCHDVVYINVEFIDRWNQDIEHSTLSPLEKIIIPVLWPPEDRPKSDAILRKNLPLVLQQRLPSLVELLKIVHAASHYSYEPIPDDIEREYFIPYNEGYLYGNPRPLDIATGTAFYLLCSQVLGVPYKPSIIRSHILASVVKSEYEAKKFTASDVVVTLLEKSREEAIREYFEKILELNMIEINMPCILAAVLKESKSPNDVIPITLQIRESKEAVAFRNWCREFNQTIQNGDLTRLGELMRDVKSVVDKVNRHLGLARDDDLSVSLGWGPASVSLPFSLPRILQKPIYVKRHLWFLHKIYSASANMARLSEHLKRVLLANLPNHLQIKNVSEKIWAFYR